MRSLTRLRGQWAGHYLTPHDILETNETKSISFGTKVVMLVSATIPETYLPGDVDGAAEVLSFLHAHEEKHGTTVEPRYILVGPAEHEQVHVSPTMHRILLDVLEALASGKAVTVTPQEPMLSTQQAADLLGLSRPTVARLIDSNELPGDRPGKHRKVALSEVLAYKRARRERIMDFLAETSAPDEDRDYRKQVLREAKAAAAKKRHAAS